MANFCLLPDEIQKLKPRLKAKGAAAISEMSSSERISFFSDAIGNQTNGRLLAAGWEKAMVAKNKRALTNFVKTALNDKEKSNPSYFRVVNKINDLSNRGALSPTKTGQYLEALASSELGVEVTPDEIKKVNDLSETIQERKDELDADPNNKDKRVAYGRAIIDTYDYVQSIAPVKDNLVTDAANLPKSIMSTADFSAPFRQGWGMISRPQFYKAFKDMFTYAVSEENYKKLQADIISRPTYPLMKKAGLRVSVLADKLSQREENFMSTLLNKLHVPIASRFFAGSERAYTGFLSKLRADVFDMLIEKAQLAGESVDPNSQTVRDIANVVNDFTGSGNIGTNDRYSGAVPFLNAAFFSPRKISATINMFNPERYLNPNVSPTARKAAVRQLVGSVGLSAILIMLHSLFGEDDEDDPRSSDFGKIKVGDTRFDVTGGNANYLVLLARLFSNQTKSSTTDILTDLGTDFGQDSRLDVASKFIRNKASPLASYFIDWAAGQNAVGDKFNLFSDTASRFVPLTIQTIVGAAMTDPKMALPISLAEMFGIGTQTYTQKEVKPKQTPEEKAQSKKDEENKKAVNQIILYAKAIGVDPKTAFQRLIHLEAIKRIDNGAIIVYRPDLDVTQKIKTDRGGNNPDMKLDHTVPLEMGGSNDETNLVLVPTATWKKYTPVENYLSKQLRSGKITKQDAQKAIKDFKNGNISFEQIKLKY